MVRRFNGQVTIACTGDDHGFGRHDAERRTAQKHLAAGSRHPQHDLGAQLAQARRQRIGHFDNIRMPRYRHARQRHVGIALTQR